MRSVEDDAHQQSTQQTGDGNSHDPSEPQEPDSVEVDGFQRSVAETDTDRGTGNAHRGGYGQRVLREDEDGQGSAHLHRRSSTGRVIGDLVTHDYG